MPTEKNTYSLPTLYLWVSKLKEQNPKGSICPVCETIYNENYDGCYCDE